MATSPSDPGDPLPPEMVAIAVAIAMTWPWPPPPPALTPSGPDRWRWGGHRAGGRWS